MNDTTVTVVGNVVDNPQRRMTHSGIEVTNFRVASTSRKRDRLTGEWGDGDSVFLAVTCWRDLGSNVLTSLSKGDPVIVTGRLYTRRYERDGQPRSAYEIEASAVGPDLARGVAAYRRTRSSAAGPVADVPGAAASAGSHPLAPVLQFVGRETVGPDGAAGEAGELRSAAP